MSTMHSFDLGVSKNRGIPKSSILIGFSLINRPFGATTIFGNTHFQTWQKSQYQDHGRNLTPSELYKEILQLSTGINMNQPYKGWWRWLMTLPTWIILNTSSHCCRGVVIYIYIYRCKVNIDGTNTCFIHPWGQLYKVPSKFCTYFHVQCKIH